tara:strand:+ start:290 stop:739 length:450 start_codon:yes stop_codon:yes gene_type:complete
MADQKLSELTSVSGAVAADSLYIVNAGASKKITIANVFANVVTPVSFSDTVAITDTDTMTSFGAIPLNTNITYLSDFASDSTLSIGAGVDGQIKIIIMTSNSGAATVTLDDSDCLHDTVTFSAVGHTATLIYTNSKWTFIGGTAAVVNN